MLGKFILVLAHQATVMEQKFMQVLHALFSKFYNDESNEQEHNHRKRSSHDLVEKLEETRQAKTNQVCFYCVLRCIEMYGESIWVQGFLAMYTSHAVYTWLDVEQQEKIQWHLNLIQSIKYKEFSNMNSVGYYMCKLKQTIPSCFHAGLPTVILLV